MKRNIILYALCACGLLSAMHKAREQPVDTINVCVNGLAGNIANFPVPCDATILDVQNKLHEILKDQTEKVLVHGTKKLSPEILMSTLVNENGIVELGLLKPTKHDSEFIRMCRLIAELGCKVEFRVREDDQYNRSRTLDNITEDDILEVGYRGLSSVSFSRNGFSFEIRKLATKVNKFPEKILVLQSDLVHLATHLKPPAPAEYHYIALPEDFTVEIVTEKGTTTFTLCERDREVLSITIKSDHIEEIKDYVHRYLLPKFSGTLVPKFY